MRNSTRQSVRHIKVRMTCAARHVPDIDYQWFQSERSNRARYTVRMAGACLTRMSHITRRRGKDVQCL